MADNNQSHETIDEWQCIQCHSTVPANQPSVFNAANCSCVKVGSHADGAGEGDSQPPFIERSTYFYETANNRYPYVRHPRSDSSSSLSVACPEGPEREYPQIQALSSYLPLGPSIGLNEAQHQRIASFRSGVSYPMQRFLDQPDCPSTYATQHVPVQGPFLTQGLHIQSETSMRVLKTSRKKSRESMQSFESAETSCISWRNDPLTKAGAWVSDGGDERPGQGYALALSGLEDFHIADSDARSPFTTDSVVEFGKGIYDHSNDRQSECGINEETPASPEVSPGENKSYPLPQAWMTRSGDDTRDFSLPENPPNSVTRTKLSIIALSTAAVVLRRWIRSSRRLKEEITLISAPDITGEQALSVSDHRTQSPASTSGFGAVEGYSSSYADSVDSLEDGSIEDSQDDENHSPQSGDELITYEDFVSEFLPFINQLPNEIALELKRKLVVLAEFWLGVHGAVQCPLKTSETPQSSDFDASGNSLTPSSSKSGERKRASSEGDGSSPPGDGGDGRRKRFKTRPEPRPAESNRRWACPFYQREPHRYCLGKWRLCAKSPGFREVHRVKAHIYDRHAAIYCERCYIMFDSDDDLLNHRRQLMGCNVGSPRPLEGLTKEQKELLRPRDRNKSEEERWNTVYKICFPDDDTIPSPYFVYYSRETAELRREIFDILRQEIPQSAPVNRERLLQRVQNAFGGRLTLPSETPDMESNLLLPDGIESQIDLIDETSEDPPHGSEPSDPLSLRQAHCVESFQSDLTQEPVSDDFGDIVYWDNLPANNLQVSLDEQMPLQLDFPLPLQADGSFNDGLNWDGTTLNTV